MTKPISRDTLDAFELGMRIARARERSEQLISQTRQLRRESREILAAAALKQLQLLCLMQRAARQQRRCRESLDSLLRPFGGS